ncbi:unnamed protein product [Paramecium sonneborni]|uniref:Uncharacterized protein n=1 Tax=Paramecium sonneborni TaxID=65129 RepID=A0A8S1MP43_9CILI|nr:unnamed protein product [Paramecium sonneborni]
MYYLQNKYFTYLNIIALILVINQLQISELNQILKPQIIFYQFLHLKINVLMSKKDIENLYFVNGKKVYYKYKFKKLKYMLQLLKHVQR